jgi:hypothetical protein
MGIRLMRRRRLTYFLLATALGLWSCEAQGQTTDDLRPGVDDNFGIDEPIAPQPTLPTLTLPEEKPPPAKKRRVVEEPYAPQGIGTGGLRVYPVLRLGGIFSDNVSRTNSNRESDVGLRLRPAVRIESDWIRHSFDAAASGDFIAYSKQPDFDTATGDIEVNSRIDVRHGTTINAEAFYDATQVDDSESDIVDDFVGLRTDQDFGGAVSWSQGLGRFQTKLRAGITRSVFGEEELADGTVDDNEDRNYVAPRVSLRGSYGVSAVLRPFVEVAYNPRFHDEKTDRNGIERDSQGYEAIAGFTFSADPVWSVELGVTYQRRDFEDASLDAIDAVGLIGDIIWRPNELTTVALSADTSIGETDSVSSGGTRNYTLDLDVTHDLRENISLLAGLGIDYDEFLNGPDDVRYSGNLGITYRFNPWLAWTASYDLIHFDSGLPGNDYTENRFTAGIELRR